MKVIAIVSMLCIWPAVTFAQVNEEDAKNAAFQAVKNMDEALIKKDYDTYTQYNHPKVLENIKGGRDAMAVQTAEMVRSIEESGNYITAVWPGKPMQLVDTAGELQVTIPQFMEYRLPEGKIKTETTLVCISPDNGKTWYIIDSADKTLADLRNLFPTLSSRLVIPQVKEPVFTKDE